MLSRLAAARKRLADRLTRRGCTLPATLTATALSGRLVSNASAAATAFRSGLLTATTATVLAKGVLNTMSRVTFLTAFGGIALAASLAGGVGWIATDRGPNVAFAAADAPADPPKPAPKPPTAAKPDPDDARRTVEEKIKGLERIAAAYKAEIESLEQYIERANRIQVVEAERAAKAQLQLTELDTEVRTTARELTKLEAELVVLKKRLDEKNQPPVDAAALDAELSRDVKVDTQAQEVANLRELIRRLNQQKPDAEASIAALKEKLTAAEKELDKRRAEVRPEIIERFRGSTYALIKKRAAELDLTVAVKREILDKLKAERDTLGKAAAAAGDGSTARANEQLALQREALARAQRQLLTLRAQRDGVTLTEASGTDAKLDAILKELAALRKEVQELKAKK